LSPGKRTLPRTVRAGHTISDWLTILNQYSGSIRDAAAAQRPLR